MEGRWLTRRDGQRARGGCGGRNGQWNGGCCPGGMSNRMEVVDRRDGQQDGNGSGGRDG